MKKDPTVYLGHMLDSVLAVESYLVGVRKPSFMKDQKLQDAVVRRLEIIGEAAKRVTEKVRESDASIPWKQICGMRDVLVHDYAFVDMNVVWPVAKREIPKLKKSIQALIKELGE